MAVLGVFTKQPIDVQDYDVDYSQYLDGISDTILNAIVEADTGLTIDAHQIVDKRVKVWVAGGVSGTSYKVTVTVNTVGGRTKQAEIKVKVKET